MKLLRFGTPGQERPGMLDAQGQVRDLSGVIDDITGKTLSAESLSRLAVLDIESLPLVDSATRLGPCVNHVGKFICIGLNYA
ncbi:MAG TPA: 2-hydroxyhepta-2,4-diene-1,7-dioate isomerase, partial [Cellvibrio sp.]|nr:2-hydroxyhepta-2,4-diene-1,7-dioate isomerase [Cellvibrio sp.]